MAEGIEVRHGKTCRSHDGRRCSCEPSYRASVWSRREKRLLRKTFTSAAEAKSWRSEANVAVQSGKLRAATAPRFCDVFGREVEGRWQDGQWLNDAKAGRIRSRSRRPFKESTIRAVRQ